MKPFIPFFLFLFSMSLLTAQNVGVGTIAPIARLDIRGVGASPTIPGNSSTGILRIGVSANEGIDVGKMSDSPFSGWIQAGFNTTIADPMSLQPMGGNVGIGVVSPGAKLHISHNSTTSSAHIKLTETSANDFARIKFETESDPGIFWDLAASSDSTASNSKLNFYYNNPGNTGDKMTITGSGQIGIGITSPLAKLDILGGDWNLDAGNPGDLRIGNGPANAFRIGVATGGGGAGTVRLYSQGGPMMLGSNNMPRMTITPTGNIGVGETNPGNRFRVVGSTTETAHVLSVSSGYVGSSDIRAIEGFSTPATGRGIGGYFYGGLRGIQATAQGTSSTGLCIGLEASAFGTAGTRTGLFARASGGATNWAGFFAEGNVYVTNDLRVGSGALGGATGYKVAIAGKLIAEEIRIQLSGLWPDYVFKEDYHLMPLDELSAAIKRQGHLPGIPAAHQIESEGMDVGNMQSRMMEKIEELTLYVIELNNKVKRLEKENEAFRKVE